MNPPLVSAVLNKERQNIAKAELDQLLKAAEDELTAATNAVGHWNQHRAKLTEANAAARASSSAI